MDKVRVIEPYDKHNYNVFKILWKHKDLISAFAKRDILNHYAQTRLGLLWVFIQAVVAAIIIKIFFTDILNVTIPGIKFILYAYPGMMAWYFFNNIINNSGTSLLSSQHIITKIYFPKIILPIYKVFAGLIDFLIWLIVYILMLVIYNQPLSINMLFLPIIILLNIITGLSVSILLSAITVRYRDAIHIIPYLIGFGVFATPIFFSEEMVPQTLLFIFYLNPMAGVIMLYRWCLLEISVSYYYIFGILPVIILTIIGIKYFKKIESTMADII